MDLTPLTHAPLPIRVHAFAALGAFVLGAVQLARVKGTTQHRALGYTWALPMLSVAVSSFWVHEIRSWGRWSPIHLLSVFTLVMLPLGIWQAHRHCVRRHRQAMIGLFCGALLIAGLFTLLPGRIMHKVLLEG
jgi:uncharacterized membrane protein